MSETEKPMCFRWSTELENGMFYDIGRFDGIPLDTPDVSRAFLQIFSKMPHVYHPMGEIGMQRLNIPLKVVLSIQKDLCFRIAKRGSWCGFGSFFFKWKYDKYGKVYEANVSGPFIDKMKTGDLGIVKFTRTQMAEILRNCGVQPYVIAYMFEKVDSMEPVETTDCV